MSKIKLSPAQVRALKFVERRNYPAGEPRITWINEGTARVLMRHGLIEIRKGTDHGDSRIWRRGEIVDLTEAGRAFLSDPHKVRDKGEDKGRADG